MFLHRSLHFLSYKNKLVKVTIHEMYIFADILEWEEISRLTVYFLRDTSTVPVVVAKTAKAAWYCRHSRSGMDNQDEG
jgi:hypothetical protein